MKRLTKKEIARARNGFWIAWAVLISIPLSTIAWLFSEGSLWASPSAVIISTVIGYNVFETWLKRRQWTADNTLVMCYCGHPSESHGAEYDMDRACYHGDDLIDYSRNCLCRNYAPRFWKMSKHT